METRQQAEPGSVLRLLPSVSDVLATAEAQAVSSESGPRRAADMARSAVEGLRAETAAAEKSGSGSFTRQELLAAAAARLETAWRAEVDKGLRRVINATGVLIHTNLGRAPLSAAAKDALIDAAGYCTLEYDISAGRRGRRGGRAEDLLKQLTGAEAAIVVNNGAAAAFFVLSVFAAGREVIVSRGEMVEIGGDFRVPDVLSQSGAVLNEIGTTNRTHLRDYQGAIGERTAMIMRVHTSNYKIIGFTNTPELKALAGAARENDVLLYEDAGSGALTDLSRFGLSDEPVIARSIADGADIVSFSGDKLLGGPQAGLIVGRRDLIERLRKHPLYRALRVDKLAYAGLEATLEIYARGSEFEDVPVLKMLSADPGELRARTEKFVERLRSVPGLKASVSTSQMAVGGGAAPGVNPETPVAVFSHDQLSPDEIEKRLRLSRPVVVARIADDKVIVDLRTVDESDEEVLIGVISRECAAARS